MKAVVFEEFGSPRKVLRLVERPMPEPGPGQVRVKLVLSPIHNHDLMIVTGHYGYKPQLPHVPGTEALGVVDKLGDGVTNLKVGQRVTGGAPIKRALDSVAGRASDELMDLVAEEGWLISFGALSGRPVTINADNLLFKRAVVKGFWAAKPSTFHTPEQIRGALLDFVRRATEGSLKLPIAEVFPLEQAAEAAEASNAKGRQGKIAIRGR